MSKVTRHGAQRIKKRIGSRKPELLFAEALQKGMLQNEAKGDLKRFLAHYSIKHGKGCVIYKGFIYWHANEILITVTPLPQRFIKYIKERKDNE